MSRAPKPAPSGDVLPLVGFRLADALPPQRKALRLDELAEALGISRRSIERLRSSGRFPKPSRVVGRMPIWSLASIDEWLEGGDQK